jgi:hypothetical protein
LILRGLKKPGVDEIQQLDGWIGQVLLLRPCGEPKYDSFSHRCPTFCPSCRISMPLKQFPWGIQSFPIDVSMQNKILHQSWISKIVVVPIFSLRPWIIKSHPDGSAFTHESSSIDIWRSWHFMKFKLSPSTILPRWWCDINDVNKMRRYETHDR